MEAAGRRGQACNPARAGTTGRVLCAGPGRRPGQLIGKTPGLQSVYAPGSPYRIGQIVETRLLEGYANSLSGEIVLQHEAAA